MKTGRKTLLSSGGHPHLTSNGLMCTPQPSDGQPPFPRGLFLGWGPGPGSPRLKRGPAAFPASGQAPGRPSIPRRPPPHPPPPSHPRPGVRSQPDLHSPGQGELRRSHRKAVVSRVRAMPTSRGGESPVLRLPPRGSAHLQQRHDRLDPEMCPLSEKEVKAKARSLQGREPESFPHPPALAAQPVRVGGPGVSYSGQASPLCLHEKMGYKAWEGRRKGAPLEAPFPARVQ